jgi:hypothetical protein
VETANKQLRVAIGKAESGKAVPSPVKYTPSVEELQRKAERAQQERLKRRAAATLPGILRDFAWPLADCWHESPVSGGDMEQDWRLLVGLFQPDDVIWIGGERDTGQPRHAQNFRRAADWLASWQTCPGPLTCPATFKPGTCSRANANVEVRRFLVLESDVLPKDSMAAVIRWARQFMTLRAIVDTGGKSIHGWFNFPSREVLREVEPIFEGLGCDKATLRPAQPVRLPGWERKPGRWQSLIWHGGNGGAL